LVKRREIATVTIGLVVIVVFVIITIVVFVPCDGYTVFVNFNLYGILRYIYRINHIHLGITAGVREEGKTEYQEATDVPGM
jgi:hypothetical protein